jgi:hypothetical protein
MAPFSDPELRSLLVLADDRCDFEVAGFAFPSVDNSV